MKLQHHFMFHQYYDIKYHKSEMVDRRNKHALK